MFFLYTIHLIITNKTITKELCIFNLLETVWTPVFEIFGIILLDYLIQMKSYHSHSHTMSPRLPTYVVVKYIYFSLSNWNLSEFLQNWCQKIRTKWNFIWKRRSCFQLNGIFDKWSFVSILWKSWLLKKNNKNQNIRTSLLKSFYVNY